MRTIKYPIFLACRDYTNDIFWKKIFEGLAYAEPPRGIYFRDESIYSVTKKKEFNYNFENKDAEIIYQDVYKLLGELFGLKSKSDLSKKREIFEQFKQTNSLRRGTDVWSKIKKKSMKENLIQDYVIDSQKKYSLDDDQAKMLYFYVSVGCVFKLFNSDDIILREGSIQSINGIELKDHYLRINRKFEEPNLKKVVIKDDYLHELWNNYLKSIKGI